MPRPSKKLVRDLFNQAVNLKRRLREVKAENARLRRLVGWRIAK